MKVALQFMNVNSSYTYIVQGLVIIVAVAIDIRKYLAKKSSFADQNQEPLRLERLFL